MTGTGMRHEPFSVTSEQRGRAVHLCVVGEIDLATAPALDRWIHRAESNGDAAIVVDLARVTFLDARGLRVFLGAAVRANRSGRTFELTRASATVQRILRITETTHLLAADAFALSEHRAANPSIASRATARRGSDGARAPSTPRVAQAAR